jgi:hypothetical protein
MITKTKRTVNKPANTIKHFTLDIQLTLVGRASPIGVFRAICKFVLGELITGAMAD